jgi:hypothetical protein
MSVFDRRRSFAAVLLPTLCVCLWFVPRAAAEFGPIQLVSKSATEQAGYAKEPALSGNGQFVAFRGELGGHTGIFRKDLATGALTLVVEALKTTNELDAATEAEAPSISADGQFVSFTTTRSLDPSADEEPGSRDVYVADLAGPAPTYQLVSSVVVEVEGKRKPERMSGSSSAAPRVAISADGGEVAFINEEQVYVRRLAEPEPILISARRDLSTGAMKAEPVPGGGAYQPAGAALSADGNVVAWVGDRLPEQVPLLPEEEGEIRTLEKPAPQQGSLATRYFEPLWREVPAAPALSPTRRIIGGGDPLAPGCQGGSTEGACQGPFPDLVDDHQHEQRVDSEGQGWGVSLPQLSADGSEVAVIGSPEADGDLFVVDMAPGLSRVQAVHRLTKWTNPLPSGADGTEDLFEEPKYLVSTGPIRQCAISPDGTRIAFTTLRQNFPLSPPTLLTPRPVALPVAVELYQVDLEGQTIERVTPGPGTGLSAVPGGARESGLSNFLQGEAEIGASGPSYSADGRLLAFASTAYNLVTGDGNTELEEGSPKRGTGSDVFTVETPPSSAVVPSTISGRPAAISVVPSWRLTVHAVSRPNGAVRIVAGVPGMGTLRAKAQSRFGTKPHPRKVSSAHRHAGAAGLLDLELSLSHNLRSMARVKGGLYTTVEVEFTGPGGRPLKQRLVARFRAHKPTKQKGKKK